MPPKVELVRCHKDDGLLACSHRLFALLAVCFVDIWRKPLVNNGVALGVLSLNQGCQLQLDLPYLTQLVAAELNVHQVWHNQSTTIAASQPYNLTLASHEAGLLVVRAATSLKV